MPPPLVVMILLPLNEKTPAAPNEPALRPPVGRPEGLGGVLDERDPVGAARLEQRVVVGALPVEVDGDDGGRQPSPAGPGRELLGDQCDVDGPVGFRAVDQHRRGADVAGGRRRGHEGERRDKHLVSRAHADEEQGQMECGRPARGGHGVLDAHPSGQLGLEGVEVGADRGDPVRVEGLEQGPALVLADVGGGQIDPRHGRASAAGTRPPVTAARDRRNAALQMSRATAAGNEEVCTTSTVATTSTAPVAT